MVLAEPQVSITEQIINSWKQIPNNYPENDLELNFVSLLFRKLGLDLSQVKSGVSLGTGSGLKPDFLIYNDITKAPILVIEDKKRVGELATVSDEEFIARCKNHYLYQQAVGYPAEAGNNGIKQYLDKSNKKIKPELLAKYGLVFNGDFFQLWRRVDGLILPMTPIQRVNEQTIPELINQLKYCIFEKPKALVTGIWNRKGGVAKTTNTLNLASVLALNSKKVLLIDFDTQCDLTRAFGLDPNDYQEYLAQCFNKIYARKTKESLEILAQNIKAKKYPTSEKKEFTLSIMPGNRDTLEKLKIESRNSKTGNNALDFDTRTIIKIIENLIEILKPHYDYIFVDNSPVNDIITTAALKCFDTLLIPCDYSRKTLHHAADIDRIIVPKIRENNSKKSNLYLKPWSLGIAYSNCPGDIKPDSQLEKYIQTELKNKGFEGKQYKTRLKIYAQTKLAEYKQKPVVCWERSQITKLYNELAAEIFLNHNFIDC